MGCLWGQPRPVPRPDCSSSSSGIISLVWWMNLSKCTDHIELKLFAQSCSSCSSGSSGSCGSFNALPLLPFKGTCFKAYKGPKHWPNHLCRTHHLQGLVAMLTSFSGAPGAPASAVSISAVRPAEVGQSSPPTPAIGPFCLNTLVHPPHLCSCAVFPAAPQACDYSLMPALGSKDGGGWVLCLKAANMKMLQHKCEIMVVKPSVVCWGNRKKQIKTLGEL